MSDMSVAVAVSENAAAMYKPAATGARTIRRRIWTVKSIKRCIFCLSFFGLFPV